MSDVYFVRPVPGCMHSRYFIGAVRADGSMLVSRTQISRPDGTEIPEPARVHLVQSAPTSAVPAPAGAGPQRRHRTRNGGRS